MEVNTRYVYSLKQQPSTATWLQVITNNTRQNKPSATRHLKKTNSINTTIQQSHKPTKVNNDNLFKQAHQS